MAVPAPIVSPIGIHGSIKLGTDALSLTDFCVASGTFTPSVNMIPKNSTCNEGFATMEPGIQSGRIEMTVFVTAASGGPAFKVRDRIYFEFSIDGMYTYTGSFICETQPMAFQVDGDATLNMSGQTYGAYVRTVNTNP